ncbi:hypothetical protein N0V84_004237 [Fusarium piperis]|uniref:Uncharacterized protein n=1 Tax=Fusarium piperis TaxID=1435070 RepID=A0A9W8WG01_9HYPO|nr:hypothetical protein N0V84_004237 [Fusarium piperis]
MIDFNGAPMPFHIDLNGAAPLPFQMICLNGDAPTPLKVGNRNAPPKPVILFHSSCFKFKPFTISNDFLAITAHSTRLSELEESRRFKRIQRLLAPKIYELLPANFPFELMTMIAGHLVRESAMVTAKNQSVFSQASDITVNLSEDVYASYSVVDGVRYISSLRNLDTDNGGEYHRVLNAKQQGVVSSIRICEDHLGIKFVQFLPLTTSPSKAPVVRGWWRDISPSRWSRDVARLKFSAILVESDGIKLRNITDAFGGGPGSKKCHMSWPDPDYLSKHGDLIRHNYDSHYSLTQNVRMTYFDCNSPGITGYTMGSRIYFNKVGPENEPFVKHIACDEVFELPFRRRSLIPTFESHVPHENLWFASRCELEGVKEVTLCRDVSVPHKPVIGMLVQKTDGHRDCLGQFRFDKTLETIQADRSGGLYVGLQRTPDTTYVADVRGFRPEDSWPGPKSVSWIEMPWSGTLEWKFKQADCAVMHIPAAK